MNIALRHEPVTDATRAEVAAAFDASPLMRVKTDTSGGMVDAADCLAGANLFRVFADGEPVAFYVLRLRVRGERREAEIVLAHGRAGFDLVRDVLPLIERQCACAACDRVRIETRRAGLVKKLENAGYTQASVILRKELQ
ncbi:hypothetical protein [Paraburkholderia kururiensis]|uniref:hypothetical protein n=1 Tax=Paraburkholderia kururiensis TaxID=984307 RepID=UPI0005A9E3F1|nr:hypothetical protein [Paraburkholderia kururiensis]